MDPAFGLDPTYTARIERTEVKVNAHGGVHVQVHVKVDVITSAVLDR